MKVSNQPVNVIRKLLGLRSPSAEAIASFDAEVIERNKKAFKEEQERAALEIAMRAHPAGKGLKKNTEDKPKPICALCMQPIDNGSHDLSNPTLGHLK